MCFKRPPVFDCDLPECRTVNGVVRSDLDPHVVVAPPLMWAAALDRMMESVAKESGANLAQIAAVSGSAQQHGSVYLNAVAMGGATALARLTGSRAPSASRGRQAGSRLRPDPHSGSIYADLIPTYAMPAW